MNFNIKIVKSTLKLFYQKGVTAFITLKILGLELFSFYYQKIAIFSSNWYYYKGFIMTGPPKK